MRIITAFDTGYTSAASIVMSSMRGETRSTFIGQMHQTAWSLSRVLMNPSQIPSERNPWKRTLLSKSPCASAARCAPVSSDTVCLHCRLHVEQIKRKHVLAGPDRIKHQWEICRGSEPCWLSRVSLLIKGKLPAASVPSKIIVDEYAIRETWCVINPMWN